MTAPSRTRADLLRLRHRIETAGRAGTLLHSKEEALERELDRVAGHLTRARDDWSARMTTAKALLVRARTLGGSGELARLVERAAGDATAEATWQVSMGVGYPTAVACTPGPAPELTTTAAMAPAAAAYREALEKAATAAAADLAHRRLALELAETRRRRRAVEERLLPDLEETCRRLELRLDELDREEAMRVRMAVRLSQDPSAARPGEGGRR